tara:strand:- start:3198 stop:3617 length:420 start_codon:yes stop_codon:yes gene_type:complete
MVTLQRVLGGQERFQDGHARDHTVAIHDHPSPHEVQQAKHQHPSLGCPRRHLQVEGTRIHEKTDEVTYLVYYIHAHLSVAFRKQEAVAFQVSEDRFDHLHQIDAPRTTGANLVLDHSLNLAPKSRHFHPVGPQAVLTCQ